MPIRDEDLPEKPCDDPGHNPPRMHNPLPGRYEHVCPKCGGRSVMNFEGYDLPMLAKPKRSCNRHEDCDAADEKSRQAGHLMAEHCNDDCCEECFGN